MAIISITEAAELVGLSRGTLYNRIKNGQLSKAGEGVDTAELLRVFGPFSGPGKPQESTSEAPAPSVPVSTMLSSDVTDSPADAVEKHSGAENRLIDALTGRLEAAEREQQWLRTLVEAERERVAEKDRLLNERAEQLEQRDRRMAEQGQQLVNLTERVTGLLAAPVRPARRKLFGIF